MSQTSGQHTVANPFTFRGIATAFLVYPAGAFVWNVLTTIEEIGPLDTLFNPQLVAEEYARGLVNSGWLILFCLAGLAVVVTLQVFSTRAGGATSPKPGPYGRLFRFAWYGFLSLFLLIVISGATIQAMWHVTVSEEDQFFLPELNMNDGIEVGAPDGWRWARRGIEKQSILLLAGEPRHKDAITWEYDTGIQGTTHRLHFFEDGRLFGYQWYDGLQIDSSLDRAQPTITRKLTIDSPRCVPMAWSGQSSNGYQVDVEIQVQGRWEHAATYFTKNNTAVHQHTGANLGRWHVRELSDLGHGPWSGYVEFQCVR